MNSENSPQGIPSPEIQSPLTEVSKESLSQLFQKDPLKLTDEDVERICTEFRSKRAEWALEEKVKQSKPKKNSGPKTTLTDEQMGNLLDSLDLKL